jgi:imidazolonepropionase-like amidohydrolase
LIMRNEKMTGLPLKIFKNANVLDCIKDEPYRGCIVVEGNRIKEVLDYQERVFPQKAQVIDLEGKFILPGLIDAHVHTICTDTDTCLQMKKDPISLMTVKSLRVLEACLDQGFTSVRDCGGADAGFRVAVETNIIPGPRIKISGRHLSMTGGHGDGRWPAEIYAPIQSPATFHGIVADGVDECRKACRDQLRQGADFLKIMAGGGCLSPSDRIESAQYSLEELKAVVWEAKSCGTYVSAHCYSDLSVINAVNSGIRTIEHGNLMSQASAQILKKAGAFLVPTLSAYHIALETGREKGFSENIIQKIQLAKEKSIEGLKIAFKEGCKIGSGSDILGPEQNTKKALELELKSSVMGAYNAIKSATLINAQILGMADELGSLSSGKLADVIVVTGNPLEDISIFQDFETSIAYVMKNGIFHHRSW